MGQFHQLVCAHFFLVPKVHSQLITAFLHFWDIQGKKLLIKMLVTLTSGVQHRFSNILQAAFLRSFFLLTVLENVGEINSTQ